MYYEVQRAGIGWKVVDPGTGAQVVYVRRVPLFARIVVGEQRFGFTLFAGDRGRRPEQAILIRDGREWAMVRCPYFRGISPRPDLPSPTIASQETSLSVKSPDGESWTDVRSAGRDQDVQRSVQGFVELHCVPHQLPALAWASTALAVLFQMQSMV